MPLSVLRGEAVPAARWSPHDTSLAVALQLFEDSLCSGCGHPLQEAADPGADPNAKDGLHHYEAPLPIRCHACTAVAARVQAYTSEETPHVGALKFYARKVDETDG